MISTMSFPTRIVFGPGAVEHLPRELDALSMDKPLVVADPGVVAAGIARRVAALAARDGNEAPVFDSMKGNPTETMVEAALAVYRAQHCDGLIAVGGGSPMDVAKATRLLVTHEGPLARYDDNLDGYRFVRPDVPPMVAIPTTAGTGSEVSRSSVIMLRDTRRKTVLFSPYLIPNVALCDPELTLNLPPALTAATGMDALTHCVEAYVATGFHPLADAEAISGVERVGRYLERAVRDGKDLVARTEMMVAAIQGAIAFQKGLGAAHSLAHPLSSECGVHHGLANSIVLPAVCEFNAAAAAERLGTVARALGASNDAAEAQRSIANLAVACGLPCTLQQVSVPRERLAELAALAIEDGSHRTNPRPVDETALLRLYERAYG